METTLSNPLIVTAPKKTRLVVSWALSGLVALFLTFDGVTKLLGIAPVVESFHQLGYPVSLAGTLGVIQLACLALYLLPRTAPLGAVLLSGFLGGAISTHVRIGDPLFSHTLFPVYVAALIWGGLYLRDERVRALSPFRA